MQLICLDCGGYRYFEADVEGVRQVTVTGDGLVVEDASFEGGNYSDGYLRDNLIDVVDHVLKQSDQVLHIDPDSGKVYNSYITCSRCGSNCVTPPYSSWTPPRDYQTLSEEMLENRQDYQTLRKERARASKLPVLRQR